MTCLLISAIIVCVVFVQEFANKQTDAIKRTRLQIINEESKVKTGGRGDKDEWKTGEDSAASRLNLNCVQSLTSHNLDTSANTHHWLFLYIEHPHFTT